MISHAIRNVEEHLAANVKELLAIADALSRQNLNALQDSGDSDATTIYSGESLTYTIETTDRPVNCFANQIVIEESLHPATKNYALLQNKMRLIIQFRDKDSLLHLLKDVVRPINKNETYYSVQGQGHSTTSPKRRREVLIYCELPVLAHPLIQEFPSTVFRYSKFLVIDVTDKSEQLEIAVTEHIERIKKTLNKYY